MEAVMNLWNAVVAEYGEDVVRDAAVEADFDLTVIGQEVSDDWADDIRTELIVLIVNDLARIDSEKALAALHNGGVSEDTLEELFG